MDHSTSTCSCRRVKRSGAKPASRVYVSFKENELGLLKMEKELMEHCKMNRSDLHKHFIRTAYAMLEVPQLGFWEEVMLILKIKDPKIEKMLNEILKRTRHCSPGDYLNASIAADYSELLSKGRSR